MLRYVVRRILETIPTTAGIILVSFMLFNVVGGSPAEAVLGQIDETGAVQGVSGGTGMGHDLQHYKDIIVTPTAYGQGLTFLMLTELMIRE